ncbi:MAG: DUF58 domain-containing protein, partial [Acidimicrobiales bacterium]
RAPPDVRVLPGQGVGRLEASLVASRRGRHRLDPPVSRTIGPLGLARVDRVHGEAAELLVYPDLPAARRLARAVQEGRFREEGRRIRGPLGFGTDFESLRDYSPDDDIRQVNWPATARLERPMSNQHREDQDRPVVCVVDCGRLMAAPVGDRTRLDAALDAVVAVAAVADAVGDRCGAVAYAEAVIRRLEPRHRGGRAVAASLFDLEARPVDSDPDAAFHAVGAGKRSLVIVFTDLFDEAAARSLLAAAPVLLRRHAVAVASVADPGLAALTAEPPATLSGAYAMAAAADLLAARERVAEQLRRRGATVVEAPPESLGAASVAAYLRQKSRGRL